MLPATSDEARPLSLALRSIGAMQSLPSDLARDAVTEILSGTASEIEIAAFLTGLRVKGETHDELAGAVEAIRAQMIPFHSPVRPVIDTCGTGGDGVGSVNISTASAIVAAAAGATVIKHGNRSASGVSGSSDVLERLGVELNPGPELQARCVAELGVTFLFAPSFHPALRALAPIRTRLPFRTIFNLVGPLANPSRPEFQLVGTPDERIADLMASALVRLGVKRAAVVTGPEGLDEIGLSGPNHVLWIEGGKITPQVWQTDDFGLPKVHAEELRIADPEESAARIRMMLRGEIGPVRQVVLANVAVALMIAGVAGGLVEGVSRGSEAIDSGEADEVLTRWVRMSRGMD